MAHTSRYILMEGKCGTLHHVLETFNILIFRTLHHLLLEVPSMTTITPLNPVLFDK